MRGSKKKSEGRVCVEDLLCLLGGAFFLIFTNLTM